MIERSSSHIGQKAAQTNYYAEKQAARIGLPFNLMVTINYALTRVDPRRAVDSFSRLRRHHFGKWAKRPRRRAGPAFAPTYTFAFENVLDGVPFMTMEPGDPHNVHVHWGLHVPPQRMHDFEQRLWEWVEVTTGGITGGAETIDIRHSDGSLSGYLVKGASAAVVEFYGHGREAQPQGIICGRRADTSRNIGPTPRRAYDAAIGMRRPIPVAGVSRISSSPF